MVTRASEEIDEEKGNLSKQRFSVPLLFIRLRQNTLRLAAGMNGEVNRAEAQTERRRVGYGAIPLDTSPLAVRSFISFDTLLSDARSVSSLSHC